MSRLRLVIADDWNEARGRGLLDLYADQRQGYLMTLQALAHYRDSSGMLSGAVEAFPWRCFARVLRWGAEPAVLFSRNCTAIALASWASR